MEGQQHAIRKQIVSRMSEALSGFGLEIAVCGGKYDELRQTIDPSTGFWASRQDWSKPPRLIVHLFREGNNWVARLPRPTEGGTFAYANTARRSVGCLVVRVIVAVHRDGEFYVPRDWEWLLWYCFWPALGNGTSGQPFDNFRPQDGTFYYLGEEQPYIAAGLVKLHNLMHRIGVPNVRLNYGTATQAISRLLNVAGSRSMQINQLFDIDEEESHDETN